MSHGDQEPGGQEAAAGPPASAGSPGPNTRSHDVPGAVATDEMTATPGSGDAPARDVPGPDAPVADVPVDGGAEHTAATPNEPSTDAEPRDPWERFGWIMSSIWLLFLGFPIAGAVVADVPLAARVATIAVVLVFAGVYVLGFLRSAKCETYAQAHRLGLIYLAVLVVLVLLTTPTLGVGALGLTTFLVAFSMFILKLSWAVTIALITLATTAAVPVLTGTWPETSFFSLIVLMVGGITALVRVLTDRGQRHQEAVDELRLVAERDRMARDVHDVLGHSLTVISMKAELADRLIEADPQVARAELNQIQSLSREALAEIRATVSGMRVARLADELERAAGALKDAGIDAQLPTDATVVDPRHRIVLAWVLREAVTNVVRHSGARSCQVRCGPSYLSVIDDGVGISGPHGQGLRGLTQRVSNAGGTVRIQPGPEGIGTELTVLFDTDQEHIDDQ